MPRPLFALVAGDKAVVFRYDRCYNGANRAGVCGLYPAKRGFSALEAGEIIGYHSSEKGPVLVVKSWFARGKSAFLFAFPPPVKRTKIYTFYASCGIVEGRFPSHKAARGKWRRKRCAK
ncbi:hypothetical protein HMPREF0262_01968 [Clostridium sp. ATCC 29733]|nr:hypothetical protein HMPREF0262_01968 [Clostridium sp. ATCC 29733]